MLIKMLEKIDFIMRILENDTFKKNPLIYVTKNIAVWDSI